MKKPGLLHLRTIVTTRRQVVKTNPQKKKRWIMTLSLRLMQK